MRALWERSCGVIIGLDYNVPCIGVAVVARSVEALVDAVEVYAECGVELGEPFYTWLGACVGAVVELPWYENPVGFLGRRAAAFVRRELSYAALVRGAWGRLEWVRPLLPIPEGDALMPVIGRVVEGYGVPDVRLPVTVAEDLARLLRSWSREWGRRYRWAQMAAMGRVFRGASALARRYRVLVKLEDLRGLERKAVHTAYLRRWPRARLLRLALSCTPPWTGVALVNPRATSSVCPICGGRLRRKGYRKLVCAECGRSWHRDEAAAVNIALAEISELVRIPDEPGAARGGGERMKGEWPIECLNVTRQV